MYAASRSSLSFDYYSFTHVFHSSSCSTQVLLFVHFAACGYDSRRMISARLLISSSFFKHFRCHSEFNCNTPCIIIVYTLAVLFFCPRILSSHPNRFMFRFEYYLYARTYASPSGCLHFARSQTALTHNVSARTTG